MTESPLYVPSGEKIACPLDKATAAVALFDREITTTLSFVRALIADWLKSCRKMGDQRGGKAVIMTVNAVLRRVRLIEKKIERGSDRVRERENERARARTIETAYIDCMLQQQRATKYPRALFDLFPHLLKWREIQQSYPSGTAAATRHRISRVRAYNPAGSLFLPVQPVSPQAFF